MKIKELQPIIKKKNENLLILIENNENQENHKILYDNHENYLKSNC